VSEYMPCTNAKHRRCSPGCLKQAERGMAGRLSVGLCLECWDTGCELPASTDGAKDIDAWIKLHGGYTKEQHVQRLKRIGGVE
jgi:hypothetical protein